MKAKTVYQNSSFEPCAENPIEYHKFLQENGSYLIQNPIEIIAKEIEKISNGVFKGDLKYKEILKAIQNHDKIQLRSDSGSFVHVYYRPYEGGEDIIVSHFSANYDDVSGDCKDTFVIQEVDSENVMYFATENFLNPQKYCASISRFYHEPFATKEEAEAYIKKMKLHYDGGESCRELLVLDISQMKDKPWFIDNMFCLQNDKDIYNDDTFIINQKFHREAIEKTMETLEDDPTEEEIDDEPE